MYARCLSEFREIVHLSTTQGWKVTGTSKGHWRFLSPDTDVPAHVVSGTPSNPRRFIQQLRSELRRKGLRIPH